MNVEGSTHRQVVDLIKSGGDCLTLTVISVTPRVSIYFSFNKLLFLPAVCIACFWDKSVPTKLWARFHDYRLRAIIFFFVILVRNFYINVTYSHFMFCFWRFGKDKLKCIKAGCVVYMTITRQSKDHHTTIALFMGAFAIEIC